MSQDNKKQTPDVLSFNQAAFDRSGAHVLIRNQAHRKWDKSTAPYGKFVETDASYETNEAFLTVMGNAAEDLKETIVVKGDDWVVMTRRNASRTELAQKTRGFTCDHVYIGDIGKHIADQKRGKVLELVRGIQKDLESVEEKTFDVNSFTLEFINDALELLGRDTKTATYAELTAALNEFLKDEHAAKKAKDEPVTDGARELSSIHVFTETDLMHLIGSVLEEDENIFCMDDYYLIDRLGEAVLNSVGDTPQNEKTGIFDKAAKLVNMTPGVSCPANAPNMLDINPDEIDSNAIFVCVDLSDLSDSRTIVDEIEKIAQAQGEDIAAVAFNGNLTDELLVTAKDKRKQVNLMAAIYDNYPDWGLICVNAYGDFFKQRFIDVQSGQINPGSSNVQSHDIG